MVFDPNNVNPRIEGFNPSYMSPVPSMGLPLALKGQQLIHFRIPYDAGDNEIYVVPRGKKFMPLTMVNNNYSGAGLTVIPYWKKNGVSTKISSVSNAANNGQSILSTCYFVFEAEESFVINSATGSANRWGHGVLFDADVPLKTYKGNPSTANLDLITVPAGKKFFPIAKTGGSSTPLFKSNNNQFLHIQNESGGTRTYTGHYIRRNDTVGNLTSLGTLSINNALGNGFSLPPFLDEYEVVRIISDANTATQFAWMTGFEVNKVEDFAI